MMRSMSKQAEAERERRARVIAADGEYQASQRLTDAAATMADTPGALQLRLLQTVVDVSAEKNSTLVMPFPVELLRFFDHQTGGAQDASVRRAEPRMPATSPLPADAILPPAAAGGPDTRAEVARERRAHWPDPTKAPAKISTETSAKISADIPAGTPAPDEKPARNEHPVGS
jgi:hypothetical protein